LTSSQCWPQGRKGLPLIVKCVTKIPNLNKDPLNEAIDHVELDNKSKKLVIVQRC